MVQAQSQSDTIYTGDITVETQAQVNALNTTLSGKTIIDGSLAIGYPVGNSKKNITDLTPLTGIVRITGNIAIQQNEQLANLNGLDSLQSIGGRVYVYRNDSLTDLGDFPVLQSIGGRVYVGRNSKLTDLGDFPVLQTIGGYFYVDGNSDLTDLGDFPDLQTIGGNFNVSGNSKLTDLGDFPDLQTIGGSFSVYNNNILTDVGDFPVLQSIEGNFRVTDNDTLTTLGNFPVLTSIGTGSTNRGSNISIQIESNSSLSDCYTLTDFLPGGDHAVSGNIYINNNALGCSSGGEIAPHTIAQSQSDTIYTGDITVETQAQVNALNTTLSGKTIIDGSLAIGYPVGNSKKNITDLTPLTGIVRITGNIAIQQNEQLANLNGLDSLQSIGGRVYVYRNDSLTDLGDFPVLQSIGGRVYVGRNSKLTDLGDFPVLQTIGGYFYVDGNSDLTDLGDFPDLQTIGGNFNVSGNSKLTDLGDFPDLQTIGGSFSVYNNNILTDVGDFPVLQSIEGNFRITDNDTLTTLGNFPVLTSIGTGSTNRGSNISIQIESNSSLSDCYTLTDFLPGGDHAVSGNIYINNNALGCSSGGEIAPHTIAQSQSDTIYTGDITVETQAQVNALNTTLSGKTIIDGSLAIGYPVGNSKKNITDLTPLTGIVRITGNIAIQQNEQLANLNGLDSLQSIGGRVYVYRNDSLTDLGYFPVLQSIGGRVYVGRNSKLTDLGDFPVLQTIGGYFYVDGNSDLTDLGDFPDLQTIGGNFNVSGNSKLTDLGDFPDLQTIGGSFSVYNNNILTDLGDFPVLQSIEGNFRVTDNDTLTTLGNFPVLTSIGTGSTNRGSNISIQIESNSSLSDCYTLTDFLPGGDHAVSGNIYINNNALGCSSGGEIMASAPHTIMLTSHTDGDSIAIAYDEVTTQTIMFSIGGGATGWTSDITGDDFITMDPFANVADTGVVITVSATPTENTGVARSATIRITTMGGTGATAFATVMIMQSAALPTLTLTYSNVDTLAHDDGSTSVIEFSVANATWTAESSETFVTLDPTSGNAGDNLTVTATAEANAGAERMATITITATDGTTTLDTMVTLTQAGSPPQIQDTTYIGNIVVRTQAEVNALNTTLAGKTIINGNLTIGYTTCCSRISDITDLTPLRNMSHITGNLRIERNRSLDSLTDLNTLQSIGGYFYVG